MACDTCSREKGGHPHVRWGGQRHRHGEGERARPCSEEHRYCMRPDCPCGRHVTGDSTLVKMGLVESRGRRTS